MKWIAAVAALVASPCAAQSIAGVELGMPEADALAALGGSPKVNNMDGGRLIVGQTAGRYGGVYVTTCRGLVTSVQESFGTTLLDFVGETEDVTKDMGKPVYRTKVARMREGTGTSLTAEWRLTRGAWEVEMFQFGSQAPQVTRRLTMGAGACPK